MFDEFYRLLSEDAFLTECGVLCEDVARKLFIHAEELADKGKKYNLTAITDPKEVAVKHMADCLHAAAAVKRLTRGAGASLIDVGSGGGFPSLPIAAACENVSVWALDATEKKCGFIKDTAEAARIPITAICARGEEYAAEKRESFDIATARAVAALPILSELCLPFVRPGGYFIAMKGPAADEELENAENALRILGAKLEEKAEYRLSDGSTRCLLIFKKTAKTPSGYPRMYSKIKKKPL